MRASQLILAICLALLTSGCAGVADPSAAQNPNTAPETSGTPGIVEVLGGDEQALRELLGRRLHYGGPQDSTVVYVGTLPNSSPMDLPIPDDWRILGSVVRSGGRVDGTELYLEAGPPPEQVLEFYREQLPDAGWSEPEEPGPSSGFLSEPFHHASFCHEGEDTSLWVSAQQTVIGTTDVTISIQPNTDFSVCTQAYGPGSEDRIEKLLPALTSPPGAQVDSGSMSSGSDEGDMSAVLRSDHSATELADHYRIQLEDMGWEMAESGSAEGSAWSFWQIESEDVERWVGTLLILESAVAKNGRVAWFRIELAEPDS